MQIIKFKETGTGKLLYAVIGAKKHMQAILAVIKAKKEAARTSSEYSTYPGLIVEGKDEKTGEPTNELWRSKDAKGLKGRECIVVFKR